MRHGSKAVTRTRIYGLTALLGAIALAVWLGYLVWSGRWAQLDPVYATSAVILLWLFTLLDARATVATLRDEIEALQIRDFQRTQRLRQHGIAAEGPLPEHHKLT
jgi:hypothetical protein